MSCFGQDEESRETKGVCKACGEPIDDEGWSLDSCSYSPTECETCGHTPCDNSC